MATKSTLPITPLQEKIIETQAQNPTLTTRQLAKLLNCDHSTISKTLNKHGIDYIALKEYKNHRADILDDLGRKVIASITAADIKKLNAFQRMSVYGIAYDKMRVERGLGDSAVRPMIHVHISTTLGAETRVDNAIDIDPPMKTITYDKE